MSSVSELPSARMLYPHLLQMQAPVRQPLLLAIKRWHQPLRRAQSLLVRAQQAHHKMMLPSKKSLNAYRASTKLFSNKKCSRTPPCLNYRRWKIQSLSTKTSGKPSKEILTRLQQRDQARARDLCSSTWCWLPSSRFLWEPSSANLPTSQPCLQTYEQV